MKVRMVVTHAMTGEKWSGEPAELTQSDLDEAKENMKQLVSSFTYLEVDDVILPGDFVRHNCVISFVVDAD